MGGGSAQPLGLESHSQSTPATPATTPPGTSMPGLQPYQSHQLYEGPRPMYSATSQQPQYGSSMARGTYTKQEMGPPVKAEESKTDVYLQNQANEQLAHGAGSEADQEHESDYTHEGNTGYATHRGSYSTYPPDINGSPSHTNGSGRGTPRNSTGSQQQQWSAGNYTPPRAPPSSNLYNPMSDARGTANGSSGDQYSLAPLHPYAPTQTNGVTSNKRMRDDDDYNSSRPDSRGDDFDALKRRKMGRDNGSGGANMVNGAYDNDSKASLNRPRSMATPRARVRA